MNASVRIEGLDVVRRMLDRLRGKEAIGAIRSGMRDSEKPTLAEVKERTPVRTGRLRASMGIASEMDQGAVLRAVVGPRRSFTMAEGDTKRAFTTSAKAAAKAKARGHRVGRVTPPHVYARFVETGVYPRGRRKLGPARMLAGGFEAGRPRTLADFASNLRNRVIQRLAKLKG